MIQGCLLAADAGLILFWQVDYCCNNIRLVLVMQTASTHCSLVCAGVCAGVHSVLQPLNLDGLWGSGRIGLPYAALFFSLSLLFNHQHHHYPNTTHTCRLPSSLLNSSSGFLPPCRLEERPLTAATVLFAVKTSHCLCCFRRRRQLWVRHLLVCGAFFFFFSLTAAEKAAHVISIRQAHTKGLDDLVSQNAAVLWMKPPPTHPRSHFL